MSALFLLAWRPFCLAADFDPETDWKTAETAHFAIHFPQAFESEAKRLAVIAEEVYERLTPLYQWRPEGRVHVVMATNTSEANGLANIVPFNHIRLNLAPPRAGTALDHHDDWLRTLFVHEFTHILHMDMAFKLPAALRHIFGRVVAYNAVHPQWVHEGLATFEETEQTSAGRGRSAITDMIIRMAALENDFPRIDQAHVWYRGRLGGAVAYYFGVRFWQYLARYYGVDKVREYQRRHAGYPVPLLIGTAAETTFGDDFPNLWEKWRAGEVDYARKLAARVAARGGIPAARLTFNGGAKGPVRAHPSGAAIWYIDHPDDGPAAMVAIDLATNAQARLFDSDALAFAHSPGGAWVVEEKIDSQLYSDWGKLYARDLVSGHLQDLSGPEDSPAGSRSFPDIRADGHAIVATSASGADNRPVIIELDDDRKPVRVLPAGPEGLAAQQARFSPDGKWLVASMKWPDGQRDIVRIQLESSEVNFVTNNRAADYSPVVARDGRRIFYSSDSGGIFNIYARDILNGHCEQWTNETGGAFEPEITSDGRFLLFKGYGASGYDIFRVDLHNATPLACETGDARDGVSTMAENRADLRDREAQPWAPIKYGPWKTLLPFQHNWVLIPALFVTQSEITGQLVTFGHDVLGYHEYQAGVGTGTRTRRLNWFGTYSAALARPVLSIGGGADAVIFSNAQYVLSKPPGGKVEIRPAAEPDYFEKRMRGELGATYPLRLEDALRFSYRIEDRSAINEIPRDVLRQYLPASGKFAKLALRYHIDKRENYRTSVSPGDGWMAALQASWLSSYLGGDYDQGVFLGEGSVYQRLPWFRHHVLGLHGLIMASVGPDRADYLALGGSFGQSLISTQVENFFALRGFPPAILSGSSGFVGHGEYRFPLWGADLGLWTVPLYLQTLHAAIFADFGTAYSTTVPERADFADTHAGVGGELRGNISVAWAPPVTGRLGVAFPARGSRMAYLPERWTWYLQLGSIF